MEFNRQATIVACRLRVSSEADYEYPIDTNQIRGFDTSLIQQNISSSVVIYHSTGVVLWWNAIANGHRGVFGSESLMETD